jgi:hypothetical protein
VKYPSELKVGVLFKVPPISFAKSVVAVPLLG